MSALRPPRWLIVFLANLLLAWLVGLLNNQLGRFSFLGLDHVSIHLYLGGLTITYAALKLDRYEGYLAVIMTALAYDAMEPVPFGTSIFLFGFAHAILVHSGHRLLREGPLFNTVLALFVNLGLFLMLSVLLVGASPRPAEAWLRLFVDLIASQLVITLITPWFLALQDEALTLFRPQPEPSRRFTP